jgi:hypothetical protein
MQPYDQEKEDRSGFNLSMAVIVGLFSAGAIYTGGVATVIGIVGAAAAVYLVLRTN